MNRFSRITFKPRDNDQVTEGRHTMSYLEEGEPFVAIDDHFKALVVNDGEEASVAQLVRGHRQFLQGHGYSALACS